jgi:hypothetical protein
VSGLRRAEAATAAQAGVRCQQTDDSMKNLIILNFIRLVILTPKEKFFPDSADLWDQLIL